MSFDKEALEALKRDNAAPATRYQTRTGQRRRRWLWAGGAIAAVVVAWWLFGGSKPVEVTVAEASPPPVAGQTAVLNASGYVVARRLATVSSKITGQVTEVLFEEGSEVQAGQVLARLDAATAQATFNVAQRQRDAAEADLREVEVRLAEAIRDRDRLRTLKQDNLVSASALDTAEAEATALAARLEAARGTVAVAQSNVRLQAQGLDDLVVRAPFAGVIISKDAQPGEMISPVSAGGGFTRTGIATIVDMASREIEVDVNEAYINRVRDGQRAEAVLDAYPDWRIPSRVIAIVPTADRQKATVRVRIAIDELEPRILPDMGVKVRFFDDAAGAPSEAVARVPDGAVAEDDAGTYVWRVTDGKAVRQGVRVAGESEGLQEVMEGLAPGDSVVVGPPDGLKDGDAVRIRAAQ